MDFKETNRVELKKGIPENLELEIIAFLNYKEGGIIYIGVLDNGTVIGIDKDKLDEMELNIVNRIKGNIMPSALGLFDVQVITVEDKYVIKIVISSGTEKPYYLRKKGRTPEGCYIRVGSSKEPMTFNMIDDLFFRSVKNTLKEMVSPRQNLTFSQLKIYYEEKKYDINYNFPKSLYYCNRSPVNT